jgi:hypothetical protein
LQKWCHIFKVRREFDRTKIFFYLNIGIMVGID